MKESIVLCALLAVLVFGADTQKWLTSEDGSRYFIETENKYNWYEALHECALRNMSLFIIDTAAKNEKMEKILKKGLSNAEARFYMAGHDNALGSHHYVWLTTGQEFAFTRWFTGEPNHDQEHCAEVHTNTMNWNNVPCSTKLGYMCEEPPLVTKIAQERLGLISRLKEKELEVEVLKKFYKGQLQELKKEYIDKEAMKGNNVECEGTKKVFETVINQMSKENTELLTALTKCHETQRNATSSPNKNYNIVVNPHKCTKN